jgi:DNA-binding LytR/AlgR family response regulator
MSLSCIIVEDEPISQNILKKYIEDYPVVSIAAICNNAMEAYDQLKIHSVDFIFLDITMPKLSGLDFYKTITNPPPVIFTTAYPEFATQGFEVSAVDYLVKPFSFDRFVKAVNRVRNQGKPDSKDDFIFLNADKKIHKVNFDDLLILEAMGDYVKVLAKDKTIVVHMTLNKLQELLPPEKFKRIHKSYIIAIGAIDYIEGNRLFLGKIEVPIGQTYRDELMSVIQSKNR